MGQTWSMIKSGFLEESESEEDSESLTQLQQSQATTEASSSVATFGNRGLCTTCLNDVELSNLQSNEATVDTRRGTVTSTQSVSHFPSVKDSLKDFEAPCTLRSRKLALEYKLEAYKEALRGQFSIRKLGANAGLDVTKSAAGEDEVLHSTPMLEGHVMVGRKRKLLQSTVSQPPFSPTQTLLMFQLDPKRKRSAGLPSLAFDYAGCPATHMKQKARTPLERPSEGVVAGVAVLDLGTGDAMVGRAVKKVIEDQHECRRGHVSCYNAAERLYQAFSLIHRTTQHMPPEHISGHWKYPLIGIGSILQHTNLVKYDDGKEEEMEWLDLEPNLIATESARTRPRYKSVDDLVYGKPKRPAGRRRR